jgi:hypothetical protein
MNPPLIVGILFVSSTAEHGQVEVGCAKFGQAFANDLKIGQGVPRKTWIVSVV